MRETHSIEVAWLGIWNEQQQPPAAYVQQLRRHLDENGFHNVGIVGGDDTGWKVVDNALADPVLLQSLARVSSHYPMAMGGFLPIAKRQQLAAAAGNRSIPLWASEDWELQRGTVADWTGALRLGATLNRNVAEGGITCTLIWNLLFAWNYIYGYSRAPEPHEAPFGGAGHGLMYAAEPWSQHWSLRPALFAVMHTTQFSQVGDELPPGAMGLLPQGLGSFVTYYQNDSSFSVVIETANASASVVTANRSTAVRFALHFRDQSSEFSELQLRCWRSIENDMLREVVVPVPFVGTSFELALLPAALYSCSTYKVGSPPPVVAVPPSLPFPFPYADDFEQYAVRSMVRYLTAEGGVFETAERPAEMAGTGSIVLKQVVLQPPISWYSDPLPFAAIGDPSPSRCQNYTIAVTTYVPQVAPSNSSGVPFAMVCGRISKYDSCQRGPNGCAPPHGYCLHLQQDRVWKLQFAGSLVASGTIPELGTNEGTAAHRLQLEFNGLRLHALIDGSHVTGPTGVSAENSSGGMVAIGSGWHVAYFDDLSMKTG